MIWFKVASTYSTLFLSRPAMWKVGHVTISDLRKKWIGHTYNVDNRLLYSHVFRMVSYRHGENSDVLGVSIRTCDHEAANDREYFRPMQEA